MSEDSYKAVDEWDWTADMVKPCQMARQKTICITTPRPGSQSFLERTLQRQWDKQNAQREGIFEIPEGTVTVPKTSAVGPSEAGTALGTIMRKAASNWHSFTERQPLREFTDTHLGVPFTEKPT